MKVLASVALLALAAGLAAPALAQEAAPAAAAPAFPATPQGAADFVAAAEKDLFDFSIDASRVGWINATYITDDTDALAAQIGAVGTDKTVRYALEAAKYAQVQGLDPVVRRKLDILRTGIVLPAPTTDGAADELNQISTELQSQYGKGKGTLAGQPISGSDIEAEMGNMEHTPAEFAEMWTSWHDNVGAPMREDYARLIGIANEGAEELGFADTGAMWRSKYDMPPDDFTREVDRLWDQVRPLYVSLHAYVRMKLHEKYGAAVPETGPIPAHLLGNIWAQDWSNVFDLVSPGSADPGYSLSNILKARKTSAVDMVRAGERFYTSLGLTPLPTTFWERSLFTKPADRDVVCHASAWSIDAADDLRIKMCIDPTEEDFSTIHHELGHNFYQRAYKEQPYIFRDSANQAFHEAIGDTIALSVTPEYLVKIGLISKAPDASRDLGLLMSRALEKISFLPFGLLIDQWRWQVFSGQVTPSSYNKAWWDLRLKYQGVVPPASRGEEFFDPGAKYHVPANYSYTRYFLAHILQFQFHRELSKIAGCTSPLHRCSIYDSKEAGRRLDAMLKMGQSRPWPEALEALTGSKQMDATAMVDYFAPLKKWLDDQLVGKKTGW